MATDVSPVWPRVFAGIALAAQLVVAAVVTARSGESSQFGWQMYSRPRPAVTVRLARPGEPPSVHTAVEFLGYGRADLPRLPDRLFAHLTATRPADTTIEVLVGGEVVHHAGAGRR